jgi:hypothetical protein
VGGLAGLAALLAGLRACCGRGKGSSGSGSAGGGGSSSGNPLKSTAAAVELAPAASVGVALKGVEVVKNPLGGGSEAAGEGAGAGAGVAQAPPPLPSGWVEHRDEMDVWYVGPSGETQWDRPV